MQTPQKMFSPKYIGQRELAQTQKSMKNMKISFLGVVLLLVVVFSSFECGFVGSGTTPNRKLLDTEIEESSSIDNKSTEERSNVDNQSTEEESHVDPKSYDSVDMTKLAEEEREEESQENNEPYSLGPKISDWDEQRASWLKEHPHFPNYVQPNKPRVLLVTGSSPKPCDNRVGDHYLLKTIKNKIDYCRIHGFEIFYNFALLDAEMSGFWAKLPLIRKMLLSHPEVEFLWWMDSDALFTDMSFELPWEKYKDVNIIMQGWDDLIYDNKSWVALNTGSFLIRNTQWSLDLLDAWVPMGPKGKIRDEAGKFLSTVLSERPVFEADDQSAFAYLVITNREKWGAKVYFEKAYWLSAYWLDTTEQYEEMMEKYRPGFGDNRWPFITHFTGCKPCGKVSNYAAEKCLRGMDRAFHFGDNQIMQLYGFTHKTLSSRKVVRTRKETSKPLQVKDEFGLLHPSFKAASVSSS